jgi:GT2 family glycosyltransferase
MIEIVSATRRAEKDFWEQSALGHSLRRLSHDNRLIAHVAYSNSRGLPDVFNARITAADNPDFLVFIHDDVWIDDYFFADRVIEGCKAFDVIGVAGNRRRVQGQPAWAFADNKFNWDNKSNLSGIVAHGPTPFGELSFFGTVPAECELLDGVFFAARKSTLTDHGILFDPHFDFHFYDMDFCRLAREQGLRLGTWPICITHQSGGAFGTPGWEKKYRLYLEKWGG